MAFKTYPVQENNSSKNKKPKLKRLKSVKLVNLDRLRLSMRRSKLQIDDACSSSSSSSSSSSPHYMRPTSSSSARKGSVVKPASTGRSQKKVSKLNSMRIRAKYSQFSDGGLNDEKQPGRIERTRSIKLNRLRSMRSSIRIRKPSYMKETSSQQAIKNTAKGPTRTSSLRPLRILAKIPSLRRTKPTKKSNLSVDRATCSSTLKTSKMASHIEAGSEGVSSGYHVCPYTYCSLNHQSSPTAREFVSARRRKGGNQKGKLVEKHDYLVSGEDCADCFVQVYAKPRKKWSVDGDTVVEDDEVISCSDCDWKEEGILCERSDLEMINSDDKTEQQSIEIIASNPTTELPNTSTNSESEVGSGNNLIDILSDSRKYSGIWHLIYRQLVTSEPQMAGNSGFGDRKGDDSDTGEDHYVAMDTDELDQKNVISMVHAALSAVLQQESPATESGTAQMSVTGEAASRQMISGRKMSKGLSGFRKAIATARFVKAMGRMRKIRPWSPRFPSPEPATEEERVYLRHLSMNGRRNSEELLLDYALRKVISGFSPDEQKRVARLVEAFETVNPECKETGIKFSEESNMGKEEMMPTPEVHPQHPSRDPELLGVSGDTDTFLVDERKYRGMWDLIYQHVRSSETSTDTEKGLNECKEGDQEVKDLGSTHDDVDDDSQSTDSETPKLNQSAAVKLVREAIDAILKRYEQSSEHELHQTEKLNEELQQQEAGPINGSTTPQQKKLSGGFAKLKRAIITAKFIAAMEKMRRINPRKPRDPIQEAVSEHERVYLRHLSMDGRRNEEEWMLDYALRQVISKLDPDQRRKVERLVEAFETVTPEQKEIGIRFYPPRSERGAGLVGPTKEPSSEVVVKLRGRSVSDEAENQDGVVESHIGVTDGIQCDNKDYQEKDGTTEQTDKTAISYSTSKLSEDDPTSGYVGEAVKESETENETDTSTTGDMITILSDKGKYNSMWQLIYQQVRSNESSVFREGVVSEADENDPSEASDGKELDQSAAVMLVKEAIDGILQSHEHLPSIQSSVSTEVESIEVKTSKQSSSNGITKFRKLIMMTKFINAMERLRRTSQSNWSPETVSERERVKLRSQGINQKRSSEEWMLDYALRKVISNLAPDQQKKVALIVGAFEGVTQGQKGKSTSHTVFPPRETVEVEDKDSVSSEIPKERGLGEDCLMERRENDFDSEVSPKVKTKEETESNLMIESLQHSDPSEASGEETNTNAATSLLFGPKKNNTMWHLIYQQLGSTGDKPGERVDDGDHMTPGGTPSESVVNPDNDDNDASSVGSEPELTESDTVKLLKEAIINIIDRPRDTDVGPTEDDQIREKSVEEPEKRLTKAYSKLRRLILCNKFIMAMEKRRKSDPLKHGRLELDSDGADKAAHLKRGVIGGKRNSDAWMLDHALQKAVAELQPVQRTRVAMLVKAFEKVNPETEVTGRNRTQSDGGDVSVSNDDVTKAVSDSCEDIKETPQSDTEDVAKSSQPESVEDASNDGAESSTSSDKERYGGINSDVSENEKSLETDENADTDIADTLLPDSQPECVEETSSISSDKERYSSLWGLLVKHLNSDVTDNSDNGKNADTDIADHDDNPQQQAQTPKSMSSFGFQEQEAIKLVEEALHDILVPENPVKDASVIPQDESSSDIGSNLSKVILCKRFFKAMDKMRKLKKGSLPGHTEQKHSNAEKSMNRVVGSDKKSWEEWMLDHAMQQVVGKLAPVQKKKVSLLVQAFETVGSQPETPVWSKRGKEC